MPIEGARYRIKRQKNGKAVRIAYKNGKPVEITPMKTVRGKLVKAGAPKKV